MDSILFFLTGFTGLTGFFSACGDRPSAEGRSILTILLILSKCFSKKRIHSSFFKFIQLNFLIRSDRLFFSRRLGLYETARGRNSEKIERRTSNVQHRTSNMDDATLDLF
jgi:hypothetical protein